MTSSCGDRELEFVGSIVVSCELVVCAGVFAPAMHLLTDPEQLEERAKVPDA